MNSQQTIPYLENLLEQHARKLGCITADGGWIPSIFLAGKFKPLTAEEVAEYERFATENPCPNVNNWEAFHPVCRQIWYRGALYRDARPAAVETHSMRQQASNTQTVPSRMDN